MNLYFFQHVPYETPGYILDWANENGHKSHFVNFYENPEFPVMKKIDGLVVMGGPMNIGDAADEHSWLEDECDYIKRFIESGKKVFGICLGSQMIADALGAVVKRNPHTEIGWHKVKVDQAKVPQQFSGIFPDEFITFHWHGDTFDIPQNMTGFMSSEATINQAFIHDNVAAFQFHPEMTVEGMIKLTEHNEEVFKNDYPFVQSRSEMVDTHSHFEINRNILYKFLDRFFAKEK
jgi:GMP synthase-like glutamine amidotransferase